MHGSLRFRETFLMTLRPAVTEPFLKQELITKNE
jgi:hypothetical protein